MFGGGSFITQNKILPGSYINVVSAAKATATLGERGIVAIAIPLSPETAGQVISMTNVEYLQTPEDFIGTNVAENSIKVLDEVFKHATRAYVYNNYSGDGEKASATIVLNDTTPTTGIVITGGTTTVTQLGALKAGTKTLKTLFGTLSVNGETKDWSSNGSDTVPAGATIVMTASAVGVMDSDAAAAIKGIGDATVTLNPGVAAIEAPEVGKICLALESYDFNIIAAYTDDPTDYISQIKIWRDQYGKKCQLVVYNDDSDYEGVINVTSKVSDAGADEHALVAWVAGAEAACAVNASCTNMTYDGMYTVVTDLSQTELEEAITSGKFVFHTVYGKVNVLEDINSLVTTTVDKGEDFKSNQTMRVVDQIANDIAKLFNTKYLGKIPNDNAGRISLWADIVKHHNQLLEIRAIQDFVSENVTVAQGDTKKSVVVTDIVNPVNAMAQLYMTIVVQ